jgi:PAS domain S-box-containing protein
MAGEHRRKNGTTFPVDVSVRYIDSRGEHCLVCIVRDMTGRKETEEELRRSEARLREAQRVGNTGSWERNLLTDELIWSDHEYRLFGLDPGSILPTYQTLLDFIHPDDRGFVEKATNETIFGHKDYNIDFRIIRADGQERILNSQAEVIYDNGKPVLMRGIGHDITEQKLAEEAIKNNEEQFKTLVSNIPGVVYRCDNDHGRSMTYLSDNIKELSGYPPSDFIGNRVRSYPSIIHPDDAERVHRTIQDGVKEKRPYVIDYRIIMSNGEIMPVHEKGQGVFGPNSALLYLDGVIFDITVRKEAEEALRKAHEMLEDKVRERTAELAEANQTLQEDNIERRESELQIADKARRLKNLSELSMMLTGEPLDVFKHITRMIGELLGVRVVCLSEVRGDELWFLSVYIDGKVITDVGHCPLNITPCATVEETKEIRIYDHVVEKFPEAAFLSKYNAHSYCGFPAIDNDGEVVAVTCLLDDKPHDFSQEDQDLMQIFARRVASEMERNKYLTQNRKMEAELLKARKLESLGVLAGGIAHDFNNLLTAVLGNISFMLHSVNPDDKNHKRLLDAEKATLRAKDLTQQLLTFSKGGAPILKTVAVAELIKESAGFALMGSNVLSRFDLAPDLMAAEVDEGQISQVINNMVINADHAMPDGGTINIRARNVTLAPREIGPLRAGRYVVISIEDHGIGIPKEHLLKIFDPYFTSKQKGSGLGLATAYSIIKKHGGLITVTSEVGSGTTFRIYLSASKGKAAKVEAAPPHPAISGKGRVLVMDDEAIIRDLACEILEAVGYEAVCVADGRETIDMYTEAKESGRPFDLVVMDLTVPGGMGGMETIVELLDINPDVLAIVSSGYSNDPIMAQHKKYGFSGVIAKPYRASDLTGLINTLLSGAG